MEQGNINLFFEKREAKICKFEDKSMVNKFIKRGTNKEHGNIG